MIKRREFIAGVARVADVAALPLAARDACGTMKGR
jgi:hypothetical protein